MVEVFSVIATIIVSIIGTIGSIYIAKINKENSSLKKENKLLSNRLVFDLKTFNEINSLVLEIFKKTKADRFLILSARNGKVDFRTCSVLYEQHDVDDDPKSMISIGATTRYNEFEFDGEYRQMLKDAEVNSKGVNLIVNDMRESNLKSIYKGEKVTHSIVNFMVRSALDENNDIIFYTSTASHNGVYTPDEEILIKAYSDQIKSKLKEMMK